MWCNYCDGFCINPLCLTGCVERADDRKDAKVVADLLAKLAEAKRNGEQK